MSAVMKNLNRWPCSICKKDMPLKDLTIDHIIPKAKGGSSQLVNLQLACEPCNVLKADNVYQIEPNTDLQHHHMIIARRKVKNKVTRVDTYGSMYESFAHRHYRARMWKGELPEREGWYAWGYMNISSMCYLGEKEIRKFHPKLVKDTCTVVPREGFEASRYERFYGPLNGYCDFKTAIEEAKEH
jgi:hypothetical protein